MTLKGSKEQRWGHGKISVTFIILVSAFGQGILIGQEGVIFLDLLLILQEDIERGSLLFLLSSPGFMIGALVGGVLYDKFQPGFIYTASLVGAGIFSYVIPYCLSLPLMGFVMMVRSAFAGSIGTGGTFLVVVLWKSGANPIIQLIHFTFALGALVIPLVSEPFLAVKLESVKGNLSFEQTAVPKHSMDLENLETLSDFNTSTFKHDSNSIAYDFALNSTEQNSMWSQSLPLNTTDASTETRVQHALAITGTFLILSSLSFVYFLISGKLKILHVQKLTTAVHSNNEQNEPKRQSKSFVSNLLPKTTCRNLAIYTLIFLLFLTYGSIEKGCITFLMPYAVEFLKMDKANGARLMACFWAAFAVSRFSAILIAKVLTASKMLALDFAVLVSGLCILFAASADSYIALWIASVVVGAGQAAIFPTAAAWINTNVMTVSGRLSALLFVSGAIGSMVHLPLLGYFFEEVSPICFIYLNLGFSVLGFFAFVLLFMIRPRRDTGRGETELEITSTL